MGGQLAEGELGYIQPTLVPMGALRTMIRGAALHADVELGSVRMMTWIEFALPIRSWYSCPLCVET